MDAGFPERHAALRFCLKDILISSHHERLWAAAPVDSLADWMRHGTNQGNVKTAILALRTASLAAFAC